ncbi:hypothetical protein K466DRAFT_566834 [Polyporus arcularius HHB13444]|uniref:Uncharacterized protein n=1 Tax=Polyporus arcularius HHB13444 TaxID=1314778 RepID=A0A5C3PA45_9APHY|nr:hypothetical protein K466DRAFT_566834 [Polyporus arcularius HHB13444]
MAYHAGQDPGELPPPPSAPAALKRTFSALNAARSTAPDGQHDSGGNTAALPAAIAVAVFVVTTLVVLRVIRRVRQNREAISSRGQYDTLLEQPRMWEVRLSRADGQGRWSDLMPLAAGHVQGAADVITLCPTGRPMERSPLLSASQSSRSRQDPGDEREDGSGICVTVLVTMPVQPERGRSGPPDHLAIGVHW